VQPPRFPDFWGPMDPIGVQKSDFASLRMTVFKCRSTANNVNPRQASAARSGDTVS